MNTTRAQMQLDVGQFLEKTSQLNGARLGALSTQGALPTRPSDLAWIAKTGLHGRPVSVLSSLTDFFRRWPDQKLHSEDCFVVEGARQ